MATYRPDVEKKLNSVEMEMSATQDRSDSEEEEEEEGLENQNWDDWEVDDEFAEEPSSTLELLCLFCDSKYTSCALLFEHCNLAHHFDFYGMKKALGLDFYKCFKLINYVRSQVSANKCWCCAKGFHSTEELQTHLHEKCSLEGKSIPWDNEMFLNPFLQDDALLYSFDECEECEDEDVMSLDSKELAINMSQVEQLKFDDEGATIKCIPEVMSPLENGAKEADFTSDDDVPTGKSLRREMGDGGRNGSDRILSFENMDKKHSVSPARSAENEIMKINKNYFVSYSSFGIHRDMISDKVRTDAYRQAILENPSLISGAVVMDVGCGTGILSLFAAQAGAAKVIAVEASDKMAAVATQIAKDNGLLRDGSDQGNGVIEVARGMVEELEKVGHIKPHSVDVLVSEWMGYCLLYESMLTSVLLARDRWLKPGGAILPDTATLFVAGFGREGTSIPFWENVYGFNMSCIGREVVEDAAQLPIVDVIDSHQIITSTKALQLFDLATMQPRQMDFTATVELELNLDAQSNHSTSSKSETTWCYGVVLWFETGFTERFCREKPVILSTSPYGPSTHWSQTILTFRDPIALALNGGGASKLGTVGTKDCPAVKIQSRISIVRAIQHRNIDISLELTGIGPDGRKHSWPAQLFNLK